MDKNKLTAWIGKVDTNAVKACFCVGPQRGQPVCPCRMRSMIQINGRYVKITDFGPVKK